MQYKFLSMDAKLDKDLFKGVEMRELNDTEKFTSQVLLKMFWEENFVECQSKHVS